MVYLDYNASAPIDNRVLERMVDVYKNNYGNADSRTHEYGNSARQVVEAARQQVASLLEIYKDEVFFTSGATESNNIVIQGLREYGEKTGKKHIVSTTIEHKAVLESINYLGKNGFEIDLVSPDKTGRISSDDVISKIRKDTLLVCVMHVNNETGIIQPVDEIGEYLNDKETLFHIDATQSFGKLIDELKKIKYDTLSMSAHKICGPQGIGALVLRKKHYRLPPVKNIMFGGQQERGIRPGTIPVALVAGLGKACEIAIEDYNDTKLKNKSCREQLISILERSGLEYELNGDQNYSIDSTLSISIKGVSSEALMLASKQFCGISNGSACNSNSYKQSYVLEAMGLPEDTIRSTIRVSWGMNIDLGSIKNSFEELVNVAKTLV